MADYTLNSAWSDIDAVASAYKSGALVEKRKLYNPTERDILPVSAKSDGSLWSRSAMVYSFNSMSEYDELTNEDPEKIKNGDHVWIKSRGLNNANVYTLYLYFQHGLNKAVEIVSDDSTNDGYTPPAGGIPIDDLSQSVQSMLQSANSALQPADLARHNTSDSSHNDIRIMLQEWAYRLNAILDSDDETLDQWSELVAYINSNRDLIDAITTSKVSVTDIVNNLTTNLATRPLSAAQGVVIKDAIDELWETVWQLPRCYIVTATPSGDRYAIDRTTSEIRAALDSGSDVRLHDIQSGMYHHVAKSDMLSASFYGIEVDQNGTSHAVAYIASSDNTAVKFEVPILANTDVSEIVSGALESVNREISELRRLISQGGGLTVNATPKNPGSNEYNLDRTILEICYAVSDNYNVRIHDTSTGHFHQLSWADVSYNNPRAVFTGIEHGDGNSMYAVTYSVGSNSVATKETVPILAE